MIKKLNVILLYFTIVLSCQSVFCSEPCHIRNLAGKQPEHICDLRKFFQNIQNFTDTHPRNVLLFKGPAGTGKTTGAESLSDEINAIKDKHSTDSLIKSDPERSSEEIRSCMRALHKLLVRIR